MAEMTVTEALSSLKAHLPDDLNYSIAIHAGRYQRKFISDVSVWLKLGGRWQMFKGATVDEAVQKAIVAAAAANGHVVDQASTDRLLAACDRIDPIVNPV